MKPPEWVAYVVVGVVVGWIIAWWVFPRYVTEIPIRHGLGVVVVQTDRWTGRVEWMRLSPEMVRRYTGGWLTGQRHTEVPDTSFDGDVHRLAGEQE